MATLQEIPWPLRSAGDESFEQELGYLSVDGSSVSELPTGVSQPNSEIETPSENLPSPQDPLIEKVLPRIKTRRDANECEPRAPDLSPPPSPKRMRELVRKTSQKNLPFSAAGKEGGSA
eukprot:TRINITY_DN24385_c0_g1_i1.p1 TRINITY_DN24385_c0_g1~~TRINITY_DN24385_c0_g1_i1.p1  ORF type:complete len:119 (+),score=19.80 TRINITY_DN24385_c0_g1_i1:264-620(+)